MLTELETIVVKKGRSSSQDPAEAVDELQQAIYQPDSSVVIAFCSSNYDLDTLGKELKSAFSCPVIACTTAGEIGPEGYGEWSITGFSIESPDLHVYPHLIDSLDKLTSNRIRQIASTAEREVESSQRKVPGAKAFGLLLIDGLAGKEEQVTGELYASLRNIPIVGGSAGDDLKFKRTYIYWDGKFLSNAAVFSLFVTSHSFETFKMQHFEPTDKKLVITKAIPEKRIVQKINGKLACEEYARLIGVPVDKLEPKIFSQYPLILKIGGEYYVRAIAKLGEEGSLCFFCAIDEGLVLTIGRGVDIVQDLRNNFDNLRKRLNPQVIIGCECILRRIEVIDKDVRDEVDEIMSQNNVIGFHTYGEQINAIHVSQTFTGVAIGE
jgi:hypothetical protein